MLKLSARMRLAANVLEEAACLYGYLSPGDAPWTAVDLRKEAEHIAWEEKYRPERLYTNWWVNVRREGFEAIRYQSGEVTQLGIYEHHREACEAVMRDRVEQRKNPFMFETEPFHYEVRR